MSQRQRRLIISALVIVLLFLERGILGAFLAAALAAYLLTPLVDFAHAKLKIPRPLSIMFIYLVFVVTTASLLFLTTSKLLEETHEFRQESNLLISQAKDRLSLMSDWQQVLVLDGVKSLQEAARALPTRILPLFTGAVSRLIHVILFLTVTFYLLNDGARFTRRAKKIFSDLIPGKEGLFDKIVSAFARFLEGQLLLVVLMATVSFLALSIIGVRYSLILAIFTGFAEIIPIIGPLLAGLLAGTVAAVDGYSRYGLSPLNEALAVFLTYFVLRQLEDIIVIPKVMGKIAGAHPLLIMFAVLAGGHLAGVWGIFLAVPVLAAVRILIEEYW